jgi:FkbM family methyltransferase
MYPQSLRALLKIDCPIKIVDVGANPIDGKPPYAPLMQGGNTHVVGFEPNLEALAVLEQRKGPGETYLPFVIGDGAAHTLHICFAQGMTSLLEPNPDVLDLFHGFEQWRRIVRTEPVQTKRLDDIPETAGFDLLKIDIQGGELMAMRHAVERLRDAVVVQTEVEFVQMYRGQPLFSDIDQFLRAQGFVLHRFTPLMSRTIKPMVANNDAYAGLSQTMWSDAIFVKDFAYPDRLSPGQLLRLAAIVHDCYRSYDLALHMLLAHDKREGTAYGPQFLAAIAAQNGKMAAP